MKEVLLFFFLDAVLVDSKYPTPMKKLPTGSIKKVTSKKTSPQKL